MCDPFIRTAHIKQEAFKFFNMLTTHEEFLPTVSKHWAESEALFHSTSAMYQFGKKLKALKIKMKALNR